MSVSDIAIDRSLREVFSALAKHLAQVGEVPINDEVFFKHATATVRTNGQMQFVVDRSFAGYDWRLEVELKDIQGLINGMTREWPMDRLGKSDSTNTELSSDALTKILGSLGLEQTQESAATEDTQDEEEDMNQNTNQDQRGSRPITGLEDGAEEKVDFGSISESDLDAFLNAYDSATQAPKPQKPEEAVDPLEALVASLIAGGGTELDNLDDLDDLDEEVDEIAVQSALSFIELLVKNEKLELVKAGGIEALATRLAPLLDEELRAKKKADMVMNWLLDQDEVDDVYLSDEEMVSLMRQW
jgi:hypothetical protein